MSLAGLTACGGGARESVVAQVGRSAITERSLAHWISVMAPEHVVPDPPRYTACIARQETLGLQSFKAELVQECRRQYQALRQQTLDFLIASNWVLEEAAESGVTAPEQAVERHLKETGPPASAGGGTLEDARLRIRVQLAEAALSRLLMAHEPELTRAQVARYYRRNLRRFERPERRYIDIVERLDSEAAARKVIAEGARGRSFSTMALHESLDRQSITEVVAEKKAIVTAIFAAPLHALIGPMRLNGQYAVFEVTHIIPAVRQPLAQVQSAIEQRLLGAAQRRALSRFIPAWRSKWIARTDCQPGYVVQKCRQYRGAKAAEEPLAFN